MSVDEIPAIDKKPRLHVHTYAIFYSFMMSRPSAIRYIADFRDKQLSNYQGRSISSRTVNIFRIKSNNKILTLVLPFNM